MHCSFRGPGHRLQQQAPSDTGQGPTAPFPVDAQGKEDKVVPPNQAEDMFKGLKERGVTTGLVLFDGEQHGFRGSNAIRRALEVCSVVAGRDCPKVTIALAIQIS